MDDLRHDLRVGSVAHTADKFAVAGNEAVVGKAEQRPRFVAMDRRRLDDDEADAPLGIADIAVDDGVVDVAVLAGKPRHHRWHHDAVGKRHGIDAERLQELHRPASCAITWAAMTSFWISLVPS